jgi:hypothetical protein
MRDQNPTATHRNFTSYSSHIWTTTRTNCEENFVYRQLESNLTLSFSIVPPKIDMLASSNALAFLTNRDAICNILSVLYVSLFILI